MLYLCRAALPAGELLIDKPRLLFASVVCAAEIPGGAGAALPAGVSRLPCFVPLALEDETGCGDVYNPFHCSVN